MADSIRLVKSIPKPSIGTPKRHSSTHALEVSKSNIHQILDQLLDYFHSHKSTGSIRIFINTGGIQAGEFEEIKKISS
jgi:TFIIF-interacting CTD phosphatase-like protein